MTLARGRRRQHGPPAARSPFRAAGGERASAGVLRPHPHRAAGRERRAHAAHHRRARDPPHSGDIQSSATPGSPLCFCPTTEQDLADGIGPARALADAGARLSLGSDQHAVVDLIGEARALESGRTAGIAAARALPRRLSCWRAATAHSRSAGRTPGPSPAGMRADLVCVRLDTTRTAGIDPAQISARRHGGRHRHRVGRRRASRVRGGRTVLGDVGRAAFRRDRATCGRTRDEPPGRRNRRTRHQLPSHWRRAAGILADAAVVVEERPDRLGRAVRVGAAGRQPHRCRRPLQSSRRSWTRIPTSSSPATAPTEFAARMAGAPLRRRRYRADRVGDPRPRSDDELRALLAGRVAEMRAQGTGTIEIKSGYGLTVEHEARLLRLAREVTDETTFLGAHVVPGRRRPRGLPRASSRGEMLDACAPHAAGSTSSASRRARTRSTATRHAPC